MKKATSKVAKDSGTTAPKADTDTTAPAGTRAGGLGERRARAGPPAPGLRGGLGFIVTVQTPARKETKARPSLCWVPEALA